MNALVLAYHSHNISGNDYATNDHVAFAADLETLALSDCRIVPLQVIAERVGGGADSKGPRLVGLSFDDGPVFDVEDFDHPRFGPQRSFLNIMLDFRLRYGPEVQPGLHATSFVIASPAAREAMQRAEDCGYPYLDSWLSEDWWATAVDSGLLGIGNHSWDHVHHAVDRIVASASVRDDFALVDNYPDADREIRQAARYINDRVDGCCNVFAYPFGHVNDYLLNDYLPTRGYEHGMVAAFGTGGTAISEHDSIWNIPRLVCGHHWSTPEGLKRILKP